MTTTTMMLVVVLLLLLLRSDLARGFYCFPPAVGQALAGRPAQHGDSSSVFVCQPSEEPHEHDRPSQRRQRLSTRPPAPRQGISSMRPITPSSCILRASPSPSSQDQGLRRPPPQQQKQQQSLDDLLVPKVSGGADRSTLGIDRRVIQQTIVPRLAGAITKESPLDFVVVEIPQQPASKFTPADPEEPVPKEARKPIVHRIPTVDTVSAAIDEWRERWPTGAAFQGSPEPPTDELEQMPWNLGKGFDIIAHQLGAPATVQFQDWLLQVAARYAFDAAEEEGGGGNDDVILPPPEAARQIYLQCPEALDKAGRTAIHVAFRSHMAYFSTTAIMPLPPSSAANRRPDAPPRPVPSDGRVYLEVSFEKRSSRVSWPKGRGEYLEFSVYKAGRSTSEVAEALCQRLYIKRARLSYAGAKDRRAVTAQKVRCWRLPAEAVQEAQAEGLLAKDGIMVSDYRFVDTDLSLGGLKGNHFEILLRPPPGGWGTGEAAAAVGGGVLSAAEAFRRLRDEGFVNFFGEQRFGRDGTNNLEVGLLLLASDFGGAIDRIMAPHPADNDKVAEAKEAFFRGDDYSYSMSLLPRTAFVERKLLKALREVRSDPLRALVELPREVSLLFVQAYQSLLWNQAASRRMSGGFDKRMAVEGDLVLMKGGKPLTAWDTRPEDEQSYGTPPAASPVALSAEDNNKNNDVRGRDGGGSGAGRGGGKGGRGVVAGNEGAPRQQEGGPRQEVMRVDAEAARAGLFSIKHVVLPLPGHSVKYPLHSAGEMMIASLKQDGVDDVVLEGHSQRIFDLKGAYRHVVVHPRNFGVQPVPPGGGEEESESAIGGDGAATSDLERAARIGAVRGPKGGMPPPTTAAWLRARFRGEVKQRFKGDSGSNKVSGGTGPGAGGGSLTAIRVSFSLPLGAYATTLLQHVTGEGLDGLEKAWHTAGAREGGQEEEDELDGEGFHEGEREREHDERGEGRGLDERGDT